MLCLFAALGCSALQQPAAPPPLLRPGESRVVGGCLVEHRGDLLRLCSSVEPENIQVVLDRMHCMPTACTLHAHLHAHIYTCSLSAQEMQTHRAHIPLHQSEWDMASGCAPDYAGVMASLATDALGSRPRGDRRVLMLGLGGGTIAADIMLVCAALHGPGPGPHSYRSLP